VIWTPRNWLTLAALSAFISVAVGAFAAHGVNDPRAQELLKTGAQYEFMHAIAVIASASLRQLGASRARFAPAAFLSGSVLFSGSLYALAFGAPRWVGLLTPIGGLLFLVGWAVMMWAARETIAITPAPERQQRAS
jgi:uncharacterized membrane protein YgdD (TMEM256/DUF423 family)